MTRTMMRLDGSEDALMAELDLQRERYVQFYGTELKLARIPAEALVDRYILPEMHTRVGELLDMHAEIIASKLTVDELDQVQTFYRTPAGRKILSVKTEMIKAMVVAGSVWKDRVIKDALAKFRHSYTLPVTPN